MSFKLALGIVVSCAADRSEAAKRAWKTRKGLAQAQAEIRKEKDAKICSS